MLIVIDKDWATQHTRAPSSALACVVSGHGAEQEQSIVGQEEVRGSWGQLNVSRVTGHTDVLVRCGRVEGQLSTSGCASTCFRLSKTPAGCRAGWRKNVRTRPGEGAFPIHPVNCGLCSVVTAGRGDRNV